MPKPIVALLTYLTAALQHRSAALRAQPDRGSHAVEYAIGIGLAAAAVLGVFAAYKAGLADVIKTWVFS
jgi:hypothetical protein